MRKAQENPLETSMRNKECLFREILNTLQGLRNGALFREAEAVARVVAPETLIYHAGVSLGRGG